MIDASCAICGPGHPPGMKLHSQHAEHTSMMPYSGSFDKLTQSLHHSRAAGIFSVPEVQGPTCEPRIYSRKFPKPRPKLQADWLGFAQP